MGINKLRGKIKFNSGFCKTFAPLNKCEMLKFCGIIEFKFLGKIWQDIGVKINGCLT